MNTVSVSPFLRMKYLFELDELSTTSRVQQSASFAQSIGGSVSLMPRRSVRSIGCARRLLIEFFETSSPSTAPPSTPNEPAASLIVLSSISVLTI